MNHQHLKRCAAPLAALLWAFLLPLCSVQSQDKKDVSAKPDAKDVKTPDNKGDSAKPDAKDVKTPDSKGDSAKPDAKAPKSEDAKPDAKTQGKKDDVSRQPVNGKLKRPVHDHSHEDEKLVESGLDRFITQNKLTIQIVAGVVLAAAIGVFVCMRMAKGSAGKNPPPPGESQN